MNAPLGNSAEKFNVKLLQSIVDSFANHLIAEICKYYATEKGQAAYAEWLKQQEKR